MNFCVVCSFVLIIVSGCSGILSDPFAGPQVGKVQVIQPSLVDSMPLLEEFNPSRPVSTLMRIGQVSDFSSTTGSIQGALKLVAAVSVINKDGQKFMSSLSDMVDSSGTSKCQNKRSNIRELLTSYKDLLLICDDQLSEAFVKAVKIKLHLNDGSEKEFTSWSINRSDLGGSEFIHIYSVSF